MRLALATAALCLAPLAAKATPDVLLKASLTSFIQPGPVAWPDPPATQVNVEQPAIADVPLPEPRPEQADKPQFDADAAPLYSHEEVCGTLVAAARRRDLPVAFFARLIWQESQFKPKAVSPVGAIGIAQFMPQTARGMELENPFDARQALPASAELLETLKRRFGNIGLAAAAYNSTPKRIADWLKNKATLPDETKRYVLNITGRPAESWRAGKAHGPLPQLPRQVPCNKVDEFVEIEKAERRELERVQAERMVAERVEADRRRQEAVRIRVAARAQKANARLVVNVRPAAQPAAVKVAAVPAKVAVVPAKSAVRTADNKAKPASMQPASMKPASAKLASATPAGVKPTKLAQAKPAPAKAAPAKPTQFKIAGKIKVASAK